MPTLLPAIAAPDDFYRERSRPFSIWEAGLKEIARRHQLGATVITRFPDGEYPTFALGESHVVKLLPAFGKELVQHEINFLQFITPHAHIPASRFTAHGVLDDWAYLITTRVPGKLLQEIWPGLSQDQRIELANACGRLLADLHALPQGGARLARNDWPGFCAKAVENWSERPSVRSLPKVLQIDGPRYLHAHIASIAVPASVVLHGDLAPVNLLVKQNHGHWGISGMIDFGNAMQGNRWFDLTAMGVLLQPGDRTLVHALIDGYSPGASRHMNEIRPLLQTNCLIHPLADQTGCLGLIPAAQTCETWDEVAKLFWPD